MQNIYWKKGKSIAIIILLLLAGVVPSVWGHPFYIRNEEDMSLSSSDINESNVYKLNYSICCFDGKELKDASTNSKNQDEEVEIFSINYNEHVDISETGKATVDLSIIIPSSSYADFYRELLGVPAEVNIDDVIPIPVNIVATENGDNAIISTGRESFYNSISEDQWQMLGLVTEILESHMIPFGQNGECKIDLQAQAFAKINDCGDDSWNISLGPYVTGDMSNTNRFVCLGIGFLKLMLNTFPGKQVFERQWTTTITLPKGAKLVNIEKLSQLGWMLDFGGGTVMTACIASVNESTIVLEETFTVTEIETFEPTVFGKYKSFDIEYSLTSSTYGFYTNSMFPVGGGSRGTLFDWGSTFGGDISDSFNVGSIEVEFELSCYVDFIVLITENKATVSTSVDVGANLTATFTDDYVYDSGWIEIIPPFSWRIGGWIWFIPIWLDVSIGPEFRIEAGAEAGLIVSTGAWAHSELTMGARYSSFEGFKLIWNPDFSYNYTEPTLNVENIKVWVKPAISFPIKAKIYSLIGPIVRPEIYILGEIKKVSSVLLWHLKLGFNLSVGICVGIPFLSDVCWEWSIFDYTIKEWKNSLDPPDNESPTTEIHTYPRKYGWAGKKLWIWFNVTDNGEVPSGLNETLFKVGDNDWMTYNYPEIYNYTVTEPGQSPYLVKYYSIDNLNNSEDPSIRSINVDYSPPDSTLSIGKPSNGHNVFSYQTPLVLEAFDDLTGYNIWYRIGDLEGSFSPWKKGTDDSSVTYHFTVDDEGEYYFQWCAMDGVWNNETIHNESFYVNTGYDTIYNISLTLYRIKELDEIDPPSLGEADWYFHVGFAEDNTGEFFWHSSPIPFEVNQSDLIVNETYTFFNDQNELYVVIMLCEDDISPDKDDLADISIHPKGGENNFSEVINPPTIGTGDEASYISKYDVINNTLFTYTETDEVWLKTSGKFDNNTGDENDAAIWFNTSATIHNILPIANFTYAPTNPTIQDLIQFNDSSTDPDGDIVSWFWEFGDGNVSNEQNPTHQYIDKAIYSVNLTVTDDKGAINKFLQNVILRKPIVHVDGDYNSSTKGWQIDHFNYIQNAINAVDENGTVFVYNGTYYENVVVNKTINLVGEDKNSTIIDGGGSGNVVYVSADYSFITRLSIINGDDGIYLYSSSNTITNCTTNTNINGIYLFYSSNNQINNWTAINNTIGIYLGSSSDNQITKCTTNTNYYGIYLIYYSNNNTIKNCIAINNSGGIFLSSSSNNSITNCSTNNNNRGIDLSSSSNNQITKCTANYNNFYGIILESSSDNNSITNCMISNNTYIGIDLWSSSNNSITNCEVSNNSRGLLLSSSSNNNITNYIANNNRYYGIYLSYSSNNSLIKCTTSNSSLNYGIIIASSLKNQIKYCNASNNRNGLYFEYSSNNQINNCTTNNNSEGVYLYQSSNNTISNNKIISNSIDGIFSNYGDNNTISNNYFLDNHYCLRLWHSNTNIIIRNNFCNTSFYGVSLSQFSNNNQIFHNNFVNNANNCWDECITNNWDNGYPSGGNYMSDYNGEDNYYGPNQDIPGSDGIGDIPYDIPGGNNKDNYPLFYTFDLCYISNLSNNWNFISLTFNHSINKTDLVIWFNGSYYSWQEAIEDIIIVGYIYGWNRNSNTYKSVDTIEPGYGYWFYAYYKCKILVQGIDVSATDSFITNIISGWNIFGISYYDLVNKENLTVYYNETEYTWQEAVNNSIVLNFIYEWNENNQAYISTDILPPRKAYWMYAYYDCTLFRFEI